MTLLKFLALVLEPSRFVMTGGVAVRPVNEAALRVPDVLAVERDPIARME